jgi:hypothetical protein
MILVNSIQGLAQYPVSGIQYPVSGIRYPAHIIITDQIPDFFQRSLKEVKPQPGLDTSVAARFKKSSKPVIDGNRSIITGVKNI